MKQTVLVVPVDETLAEVFWLPKRHSDRAAGYDLYCQESIGIPKGETRVLPVGFRMALPDDICALILPRSGLAVKKGLSVINTPGLIDSDYRGIVQVALHNHSKQSQYVDAGDRIAQMLFLTYNTPVIQTVDILPMTERGEGGFGSTGG